MFVTFMALFDIPEMAATFMYEHMNSEDVIPTYQFSSPKHPFYKVKRSSNAEYFYTFGTPMPGQKEHQLVYFGIPGNLGGYIQFPPIFNAIDNYTSYLNTAQRDIFYRTQHYGFDFERQPSAFSQFVVQDQAQYVASAIAQIMKSYDQNTKFSIITHSMGSLVAYVAMQSQKFPVAQLQNVFSLGGPLEEAPQLFNDGIQHYVHKAASQQSDHVLNKVIHFNFHGGPRDQLVSQNYANLFRFSNSANNISSNSLKYAFNVKSNQLKNVYQSMDHNCLFYYKHFWDTIAPIMARMSMLSDKQPEDRYLEAQRLLQINFEQDFQMQLAENINPIESISHSVKIKNIRMSEEIILNKQQLNQIEKSEAAVIMEIQLENYQDLLKVDYSRYSVQIQSNINRKSKLLVYVKSQSGKIYQINVNDSKYQSRVYHWSNLLSINIPVKLMQDSLYKEKFDSILVKVIPQTKVEYQETLMNLSPCYDKNTPIIWKQAKENYTYIEATLQDSEHKILIEDRDLLFGQQKLFQLTKDQNALFIIQTQELSSSSLPYLGTIMPVDICVQYSEDYIGQYVHNVVEIKYSDESYPELKFITRQNSCFRTYPLRRRSIQKQSMSVKIMGSGSQLTKAKLLIKPNYYQAFKESAENQKFYLVTQLITIALFLHFNLMKNNDQSLINFAIQNPLWIIFLIISINYTNATCYTLIIALGSIFDQATGNSSMQQQYSILKHQLGPVSISFVDIFVTSILTYMLLILISLAFELVKSVIQAIFKNSFFQTRPKAVIFSHYLLVLLACVACFISFKYYLYFAAVAVLVFVLIDLTIRSNIQDQKLTEWESNYEDHIQNILFPVLIYLGIFIDKYVMEIWRFQDGLIRFEYHYQEKESNYHIPCLLYMLMLMFIDISSIRQAYQSYARYIIAIISTFGMFTTGKYLHRLRPVISIGMLILSNLLVIKAAFVKGGKYFHKGDPNKKDKKD
ncbi:gpi inositol-deacylase [Stylonychia lemnae]|uniref:GPI inositol-deacylase n=1 Tax=Stylonychia lemnae TaxID=5949 RepID=A0A078A429_STYLE|nr:gpi inositol-deacylase [Stylonychia lemnae]|eukprot:CDW76892.1 gpi inositol-deacylase [Stylonychia lemnae]